MSVSVPHLRHVGKESNTTLSQHRIFAQNDPTGCEGGTKSARITTLPQNKTKEKRKHVM